jgi:hypothetical protein
MMGLKAASLDPMTGQGDVILCPTFSFLHLKVRYDSWPTMAKGGHKIVKSLTVTFNS